MDDYSQYKECLSMLTKGYSRKAVLALAMEGSGDILSQLAGDESGLTNFVFQAIYDELTLA